MKIFNRGIELHPGQESAIKVNGVEVVDKDGNLVAEIHAPASSIGTAEIANLAVTTGKIAADAIDATKIADAAVSLEHLDSGIAPSHVVKFAGITPSETDSDASVVITVTGVASTDVVVASILAQAGTASILKAVPTTNTLTFTLSGNGGAGTQIQYTVLRAAA